MKSKFSALLLSLLLISSLLTSSIWAEDSVSSTEMLPDNEQTSIAAQETEAAMEDDKVSFSTQTFPCYFDSLKITYDVPLYFLNDVTDLPYINLEDLAQMLVTFFYVEGEPGYGLRMEQDQQVTMLTRENGYSMMIDFQTGTITFEDFDAFVHSTFDTSLIDVVGTEVFDEEGNTLLIKKINKGSFDRYGKALEINLKDYDINLYQFPEEELFLVPLHTMGTFLLSLPVGYQILFNEKAVYLTNYKNLGLGTNELTPLGYSYFSGESKEMSAELAWFNYYELCLTLDYLYGLKEAHDISSFDNMFFETGYKGLLTSTDPNVVDGALNDFINYYLDDLHSGLQFPSYRADSIQTVGGMGLYSISDSETKDLFKTARDAADHTILTYEEFGNTAYITFDSFNLFHAMDYYNGVTNVPEDPSEPALDTVALIIDAHQKICRENSPIENVVLDLSLNGGGDIDAAAFVSSWFLGDATFSIRSSLTGAISTGTYRADTNLDRVFDEQDTIADKNLFCIIGPYSFSCGNLVPNLMKSSHKVTLLGRTTGGGSCSALSLTSSDGAMFQISSPYRMSYLKNGSYYDIDTGIDPDCVIVKPENFYDREALTDYINQLF